MSKNIKTKWFCLECGYTEINHKFMDGYKCPKCGKGGLYSKPVKKNG